MYSLDHNFWKKRCLIYLRLLEKGQRENRRRGRDGEMISSYLRGEREVVHKLWNTKRLMRLRFDEDYDNALENHYLYWSCGVWYPIELWILIPRFTFVREFWFPWESGPRDQRLNCLLRNFLLWKLSGFYSSLIICQDTFL